MLTALKRTDKIGWIVVWLDGKADVFEKVHDLFRITEISRLTIAKKQEAIEHVEDLRRRLVNG